VTHGERQAALEAIADEVAVCTRCRLHEGRTKAVPGEGSASTEVVFVGEGPGMNEDRQGRPFVGAAGSFLTELIETVGWRRDEVFITNVVKCRPPGNRDPQPDEIAACGAFLRRQLDVLQPALVVTLGRYSMGEFLPGARIGQAHGTFRPAAAGGGDALAYAMYHPAAALHQGSLRQTLLDDMTGVPAALVESRRRRLARTSDDGGTVERPRESAATDAEARQAQSPATAAVAVEDRPIVDDPLSLPDPGAPPTGFQASTPDEAVDPTDQLPLF
jgi:uracil-DNA glycosylase